MQNHRVFGAFSHAGGAHLEFSWTPFLDPATIAGVRRKVMSHQKSLPTHYSSLSTHHSFIRSQAMTRSVSRREFLTASAATAGIAALSPWAYARILGANDRIHFGMIGLGVMGTGHLHGLKRP